MDFKAESINVVTADPDYLAAARAAHLDLDPVSGGKLRAIDDNAFAVPDSVITLAKKCSGGS